MKHLLIIFILSSVYLQAIYCQETKISFSKNDNPTDTLVYYTFSIFPYKGDSSYRFEIFLIDSLSEGAVLISGSTISVEIRRTEKEIFFRDKNGNKLATFKFEYMIKSNTEYSDDYIKIPASRNTKTLLGELVLKSGNKYKLVFNNSGSVKREFYFYKGEIFN